MTRFHISKKLTSIFGSLVVLTAVGSVMAQTSPHDEYEEWRKAKREAGREHREYLNNPKKSNYLDWRSAQRDERREYEEYLLALEVSRRWSKGQRWVVADSDMRDEYDEWKSAQREAARERIEYVNNPTSDNYQGWRDAVADERREYAEYRAVAVPVRYAAPTYRAASYRVVKKRKAVRHVRHRKTCTCS